MAASGADEATSGPDRRAALAAALATVQARMADSCAVAHRDPHDLTLIAVTKGFPASDIATLAELGVHDIGESRDQHAKVKVTQLADSPVADRLRWHFVGRLQTNKARSVARYAQVVHSVDRADLVAALDAGAARAGRLVDVFVQVSLDEDPERGGIPASGLLVLADTVASAERLRLRGVMTVVPMTADPDTAFGDLAARSAEVRAAHPDATAISAGMSADFEAAIRHGATHLRIGSALLGRRSPDVG